MSQGAFSIKAKISVITIQDYKQGRRDIKKTSVDTVCKLANALNGDIEDIIKSNSNYTTPSMLSRYQFSDTT